MGTRGEELARRVEQGAADRIAAVEGLTEAQWDTICPDEQRSVGVLVHHVGQRPDRGAADLRRRADGAGHQQTGLTTSRGMGTERWVLAARWYHGGEPRCLCAHGS